MTAGTEIDLAEWLRERRVTEVECIIPDMSGIARGKIVPKQKFSTPLMKACSGCRSPSSRRP